MRTFFLVVAVVLGLALGYFVSAASSFAYATFNMFKGPCEVMDTLEQEKLLTASQRKALEKQTFGKEGSICSDLKSMLSGEGKK
jgi:hypothetical protein